MKRLYERSCSTLFGVVVAFASLPLLQATAQSSVSPLLEKLRPCLSKGFNLEVDCPITNYCHVLRGSSGFGDFPAKTALVATKLKDMWGCFEACARTGCFSGVTIDSIEPIESQSDEGNRKSTEIGAKIVGTADLGAQTEFECNLKAITSVSMGKSAGTSNSVMCSTK